MENHPILDAQTFDFVNSLCQLDASVQVRKDHVLSSSKRHELYQQLKQTKLEIQSNHIHHIDNTLYLELLESAQQTPRILESILYMEKIYQGKKQQLYHNMHLNESKWQEIQKKCQNNWSKLEEIDPRLRNADDLRRKHEDIQEKYEKELEQEWQHYQIIRIQILRDLNTPGLHSNLNPSPDQCNAIYNTLLAIARQSQIADQQ